MKLPPKGYPRTECLPPGIKHVIATFYSDGSFGTVQRKLLRDAEREEKYPALPQSLGATWHSHHKSLSSRRFFNSLRAQ